MNLGEIQNRSELRPFTGFVLLDLTVCCLSESLRRVLAVELALESGKNLLTFPVLIHLARSSTGAPASATRF
jgi:hypothetical protein